MIASGLTIKPNSTGIELYKNRGFNMAVTDKMGHKVKGKVTVSRDEKYLNVDLKKPVHSKEALIQGKVNDIDAFLDISKRTALNNNKRIWLDQVTYNDPTQENIDSDPLNDLFLDDYEHDVKPDILHYERYYERHVKIPIVRLLETIMDIFSGQHVNYSIPVSDLKITDSIPNSEFLPSYKLKRTGSKNKNMQTKPVKLKGKYHEKNRKLYEKRIGVS